MKPPQKLEASTAALSTLIAEKNNLLKELTVLEDELRPYDILSNIHAHKSNLPNLSLHSLLFVHNEFCYAKAYFTRTKDPEQLAKIQVLEEAILTALVHETVEEMSYHSLALAKDENVLQALTLLRGCRLEIKFLKIRKREIAREFWMVDEKIWKFFLEILKREIYAYFTLFEDRGLFKAFLFSVVKRGLWMLSEQELEDLYFKNRNLGGSMDADEEQILKNIKEYGEYNQEIEMLAIKYFNETIEYYLRESKGKDLSVPIEDRNASELCSEGLTEKDAELKMSCDSRGSEVLEALKNLSCDEMEIKTETSSFSPVKEIKADYEKAESTDFALVESLVNSNGSNPDSSKFFSKNENTQSDVTKLSEEEKSSDAKLLTPSEQKLLNSPNSSSSGVFDL